MTTLGPGSQPAHMIVDLSEAQQRVYAKMIIHMSDLTGN